MLTIQGFACIALCFMLITFVKEKPRLPPSKSAMVERNQRQSSLKEDLSTLLGDGNFLKFLLIHLISVAKIAGAGKIFVVMLEPYGYTATSSAIYGLISVVAGVIVSIVLGGILD
jgi:hypothetical protein